MNYYIKEGWRLNPNDKVVKAITKRIEACDGECPCDNPFKGTRDALCPCREYRENNRCCCTLYVKENETPLTKELLSINGWIEKPGMMVLKTPKVRVAWLLKYHELIIGYGLMPEPVETVEHLQTYLRVIGLSEHSNLK